jgi:phosphatidylserine/phosphatidylglycerophosphate/cardiolipin synthase-like enzyme/uncharacterized membrane protein YdjX (TVP38/TMEM64 family)
VRGLSFEPGRNCWTVERADRFRVIPDGEDYYRLFRDAVLRADRTVLILGWDITGGTALTPKDPNGTIPCRLDEFLRYAARRRPEVQFLILTWDYGLLFALERDPFTRWRLGWRMPKNVRFAFDDWYPAGACHHQKVVVIDDSLAFSGSMDLTGHRWDTTAHIVGDPARLDPLGQPYDPYHEVQALVEGPPATRLGELARARWRALGATDLPPVQATRSDLWPDEVVPDLAGADVAIARTMPASTRSAGARECEALYFDAIARAERSMYIENQYFTHPGLAGALADRLKEPEGPEVVIVMPKGGDGWLDSRTISVLRSGIFRTLTAADVHGRLRLRYPVASRSRNVTTFVHSKVLVADDDLVIVGSANLMRRSMGVDTECDVAAIARDDRDRHAIATIRCRLMAEHAGVAEDVMAATISAAGSLRAAVDRFRDGDRGLVPFDLSTEPEPDLDATVQDLVDPDNPPAVGPAVPVPPVPSGRAPLRVWASPLVALIAALMVAWASFGSVGSLEASEFQRFVRAARASAAADPMLLGGFVVFGLALLPLELAVIATGVLVGVSRGLVVSVVGSIALALCGYALGRWLGPATANRWISRRSHRLVQQLGLHGTTGIAMLRLAGVASGGSVHLAAGAARVPVVQYLAGTAIGMLPAVAALTVLGALLGDTLLDPTVGNLLATLSGSLVVLAAALALRAFVLMRQFRPAMARHRARTEYG